MEQLYTIASKKIKELSPMLPDAVLKKHFKLRPELEKKYTKRLTDLYIEDTRYHLAYLSEAVKTGEQALFNEYVSWIKVFFSNLPVEEDDLILNFELIREYIKEHLSEDVSSISVRYIDTGIDYFRSQKTVPESFIVDTNPLKLLASEYLNCVNDGDRKGAMELIMNSFKAGTRIRDLYLNVFQPVQKETGLLWQIGKINVAQEHFNTAVTQLVMSQFYPYMFSPIKKEKKIIVSCINGELHEIGARMIADLFEMDGWDSYYSGANTPQNSLISSIEYYKPDVLAVSATMTYNISEVEDLIRKVKQSKDLAKLKILVGGYPFNIAATLWQKLGADGFANNAVDAIKVANNII